MAENIVDDLLIKVGVKVDDKSYTDLKKEIQQNKSLSINLKPRIEGASSGDDIQYKVNKQKTEEYLSKILDTNKKSEADLKQIIEKKSPEKNEDGFSSVGAAGLVTGLLTGAFVLMKQVQQKYLEKLDRDMSIADLAYETGQTTEQMAKLSYQAKNVGLSLEQIVNSASNFSKDIFFGRSPEKAGILAALGVNPFQDMSKFKTPQDVLKYQNEIQSKLSKGYEKIGLPSFVAQSAASELSGIPANQALRYREFNSARNQQLAGQVQGARGAIGSPESVIKNFEQITNTLQTITANMDKLLSTGDVAKKISLQAAEIETKVLNLVNATINLTGLGNPNSGVSKVFGASSGDDLVKDYQKSHPGYKMGNFLGRPSASSQVKAGGG